MNEKFLLTSLKYIIAASTGVAAFLPVFGFHTGDTSYYILAGEPSPQQSGERRICSSHPCTGQKSICICFDASGSDSINLDVEKKLREVGLRAFPADTKTFRLKSSGNKVTHYFFCPKASGVLCLEDLGRGLNMISIIPTQEKIPTDIPVLENLSDGGLAFLDGQTLAIIDSSETVSVLNLAGALSKKDSKSAIELSTKRNENNEEIIVISVKSKNKEKKYGVSRLSREIFEME